MRLAVSGIYLAICAVQDFRSRKISLIPSIIAGCAAAAMDAALLIRSPEKIFPYLAGLLPGLFLLSLAFASEGAAGPGDGICYLIMGALEGAWKICLLLAGALLLSSVGGGILLLTHRGSRKTRLPFLTFTAAAWILLAAGARGKTF